MAELQKNSSSVGNAEMAQRLGRIPSPDGRPIPPNLEAGKLLIDQLEMVQEKTRGNLSGQETTILEEALKNVRLAFVEVSGGTPASMMPKTSAGEFPMDEDYAQEEESSAPASAPASSLPADGSKPPLAHYSESKKKFTKSYG
jgi:hypothetical protein